MRLVQFLLNGKPQFGAELSDFKRIYNLTHIASSTIDYLKLSSTDSTIVDRVKQEVKEAEDGSRDTIDKSSIEKFLAPITHPDKVICSGMNYKDHCEEQNVPVPLEPIIFNKWPSCIVGPYDPIYDPKDETVTQQLDWEVELVFVIGKQGKYIKKEDAYNYVAGYTIAMDGSARDLQFYKNNGQWLLGKTLDTFCPLGPALVTRDEIEDPHSLDLSCIVNGIVKQSSNTCHLVHRIDSFIEHISKYFTLYPGDLILTGTPPGVGCFRKPPEYLKVGDVVECVIDKIGSIKNEVVKEP